MENINDTKTMLENIIMAAIRHQDENRGLALAEELGCYLVDRTQLNKSTSLLCREFDLETIDKNIPSTSLINFCISFIDIVITECEKVLPPLPDRQMVFGRNLEVLETYNQAQMIKSRLGNYFRVLYGR